MKKRKKTKQTGFTLIELLVVIAIIGVLSSIVLVALQKARQSALNVVATAETRQVQNQLAIYFLGKGGYPNPSGYNNSWYCIGAPSICTYPKDDPHNLDSSIPPVPVTPLAIMIPGATNTGSLWSLFETKKAEAAALAEFSQFKNSVSGYPIYYYCSEYSLSDSSLCAVGKAWVFGPAFSGNTVTYKGAGAGDTGSTAPGFSSY